MQSDIAKNKIEKFKWNTKKNLNNPKEGRDGEAEG